MSKELYKKYRPKLFKDVVGQQDAVKVLEGMLEDKERFPHALLLSGPSGCGKTTIARILVKKLNCGTSDFLEQNSADFRGIDSVREIRSRMGLMPVSGQCRVWLVDECHKLSNDAQNAFLKILEDTPSHVYFMLCTTDPNKLISTVRNRTTQIHLKDISTKELQRLIRRVMEKEGITLTDEVVEALVDPLHSENSARKCLVLLNKIMRVDDEQQQLDLIQSSSSKQQAIEIARALIRPGVKWPEVAKILKGVDEDPEQLRWMILGYCSSIMLSGGKLTNRASIIIEAFRDNFFDSKKAGLIASCYEVVKQK